MADIWTEATDAQIAFEKAAREGYTFHCHNCGLYLDGIVAYHSPCVPIKFKMCPMCGEENFDEWQR